MSPTIQILPPVGPSARNGSSAATGDPTGHGAGSQRGSLGELVRVAGWRVEPTRTPLFNHAASPNLPTPSLGFLAQHLAQEWSSGENFIDPARAAAAYAAPLDAVPPEIEIRATA